MSSVAVGDDTVSSGPDRAGRDGACATAGFAPERPGQRGTGAWVEARPILRVLTKPFTPQPFQAIGVGKPTARPYH
jgi:hypothetical protein